MLDLWGDFLGNFPWGRTGTKSITWQKREGWSEAFGCAKMLVPLSLHYLLILSEKWCFVCSVLQGFFYNWPQGNGSSNHNQWCKPAQIGGRDVAVIESAAVCRKAWYSHQCLMGAGANQWTNGRPCNSSQQDGEVKLLVLIKTFFLCLGPLVLFELSPLFFYFMSHLIFNFISSALSSVQSFTYTL